MWQATYREIDTSGTQKEIRVTVDYSNDDGTSYPKIYEILPEELDSESFKAMIQDQLDTLESKNLKIDKSSFMDRNVLTLEAEVIDTPPSLIETI